MKKIVKGLRQLPGKGYNYFIVIDDRYVAWEAREKFWYAPWRNLWTEGAIQAKFLLEHGEEVSPLEFVVIFGTSYEKAIEMAEEMVK